MKVLGICASPRGGAKHHSAAGWSGPGGCRREWGTGRAGRPYEKILAADGLVWGSPNYFHTVTAQLKTLIDRMADAVHCQLLAGKYCCSLATGGSNYDEVTNYLDSLMINFGAFVTGSAGAEMGKGPAALEEGERKARDLGRALAEDIRTRRDYVEQRRAQEGIRSYFKELVRLNKDDWEHEYEHWNRINWR